MSVFLRSRPLVGCAVLVMAGCSLDYDAFRVEGAGASGGAGAAGATGASGGTAGAGAGTAGAGGGTAGAGAGTSGPGGGSAGSGGGSGGTGGATGDYRSCAEVLAAFPVTTDGVISIDTTAPAEPAPSRSPAT